MKRGEIWWASLGEPAGSEAGYRRPVLIVSSNFLNDSNLRTVLTVPLTTNLTRETLPTSVGLPKQSSGLARASVALLHLVATTNKQVLTSRVGRISDEHLARVDIALRFVLGI